MPPLLLTDNEAVAMAAGLRLAATRQLTDGADTTIRALAKLERVLPAALRERVNALAAAVRPAGTGPGSGVPPAVLTELALACRDHERVRFTHTSGSGPSSRRVEAALAPAGREEFLAVARSWVEQATDATATIGMPIERLRHLFGEWAQGAESAGADATLWPVGGADFRETMYALSWIPAGVSYTHRRPPRARPLGASRGAGTDAASP